MKKQMNLTVALKDGVAVGIENVESGLKCGCICPACGERLVAKKGAKTMHHFAHHAGHTCEYGYESSLHLAAKEILSRAKKIMLPAVYVKFPTTYKEAVLVSDAKEIEIEKVELEKRFGDVVPDIVVYAGGKQLFIEIYVTHAVDNEKLEKLRQRDISTIEIDLSEQDSITSINELAEILLGASDLKTWKYNSVANKYLKYFYDCADTRKVIRRGLAWHVDYCPIPMRIWRGKPYANYWDDCIYCEYCVYAINSRKILCLGAKGISKIEDFKKTEPDQSKRMKLNEQKLMAIEIGKCPHCNGKLIERHGKYGGFWGCQNYPDCMFTVSVNPETGNQTLKG